MQNKGNIDHTSRRQFMVRCAKAGFSVAAAGAAGYWFFDPHPPEPDSGAGSEVMLANFSTAGVKPSMSIVYGDDRRRAVSRALEALGGIEKFIKSGDRVVLKVNAAFASPPSLCATTHPELVSEVTRLCFKAGAAKVTVTDNPINDPASCFALTGIDRAARSAGGRILLPQESYFRSYSQPGGRLIRQWPVLFEPFRDANRLIGLAPVKDHHRSGASMTMKNWYGLLGGPRNLFHQDIHNIIKELALMVTPTLVILDGIATMVSNGPTGGSLSDVKPTGTMIVSTDQVAADARGAALLGKKPHDLPHIIKAAGAGAGTADYRSLNPIEVTL